MSDSLQKALFAYQEHCHGIKSVILGSVDSDGIPLASYAPYVMDEQKNIYVMLSGISPHSSNLEQTEKVSALFIEDENKSKNLFARKRLNFDCTVDIIDNKHDAFDDIADRMYDKHGTIIERMRLLPDFRIFKLTPSEGRFVIGIGAAYKVTGEHLDQLEHLDGGGNPHGHAHAQKAHAHQDISSDPHLTAQGLRSSGHGRDERSSSRLPAIPRGELGEGMKKMILGHMNDNHRDSLCNIAMHFGNIKNVQEASMLDISEIGMDIMVSTLDNGEEKVHIEFERPLVDAQNAHSTLVKMSVDAKRALNS